MRPLTQKDSFDPQLSKLIRYKVNKLCGLSHHDREDLRQEAALHLIRQLPKHDPARAGVITFADRVVGSRITSALRHEHAQKRCPDRQRPLEEASQVRARLPDQRQCDLSIDVKGVLKGIDPDRAEVAGRFMDGERVADVVRRSGKSRQQVRLIAKKLAEDLRSLAPERKPAPTTNSSGAGVSNR